MMEITKCLSKMDRHKVKRQAPILNRCMVGGDPMTYSEVCFFGNRIKKITMIIQIATVMTAISGR
jgi:hypothetical protein